MRKSQRAGGEHASEFGVSGWVTEYVSSCVCMCVWQREPTVSKLTIGVFYSVFVCFLDVTMIPTWAIWKIISPHSTYTQNNRSPRLRRHFCLQNGFKVLYKNILLTGLGYLCISENTPWSRAYWSSLDIHSSSENWKALVMGMTLPGGSSEWLNVCTEYIVSIPFLVPHLFVCLLMLPSPLGV